jgi:hypothetical protein
VNRVWRHAWGTAQISPNEKLAGPVRLNAAKYKNIKPWEGRHDADHKIFHLAYSTNHEESPPCSVAAFVVSSEPHTGARPSVRVCVWAKNLPLTTGY